MIDIGSEGRASCVATCQETGNLAVVDSGLVRLYHLVEKTIPHQSDTFLDVVPFLQLAFPGPITHVSLCEHYIACCTHTAAQVRVYFDKLSCWLVHITI